MTLNLINNIEEHTPLYVIISGNGSSDYKVIKGLCERHNGHNSYLSYPTTGIKRQTGLTALNAIKVYPSKYGINSLIYIVDREHIQGNPLNAIETYFDGIGVGITHQESIEDALLLHCEFGHHHVTLYCIIMGPQTFLEEEIARLIELELSEHIDLTGTRNRAWNRRVKGEITRVLRNHSLNKKRLIQRANIGNLRSALPNFCAVLRRIEHEIVNNLRD